mmetsp:Transcript_44156/g.77874  ORF Transcript_44156/g.77874 Transcript_44156/m.77874 type:complete len:104 (-) Transcript_44156:154-465(-)
MPRMKACPPPSLAPPEYTGRWLKPPTTNYSSSTRTYLCELQRALSQGGLNYSLKMVASIIRTQAPQGQAQLDFHSFCQVQQLLTHVQQVFGQHDVARTIRTAR